MWMLVIRLVISLAVIVGVLALATKVVKKRQGAAGAGALEVLARQPLTRTTSVAVVRVGDRAFVLGSGESQVTLIGEADLDAFEVEDAVAVVTGKPAASVSPVAGSLFDGAVWRSLLDALRKATVRSR